MVLCLFEAVQLAGTPANSCIAHALLLLLSVAAVLSSAIATQTRYLGYTASEFAQTQTPQHVLPVCCCSQQSLGPVEQHKSCSCLALPCSVSFLSLETSLCLSCVMLLLAGLPSVDTYFLLDCSGAQDLGGGTYSSSSSSDYSNNSDSSAISSYRKSLAGLPAAVQHLLQRRQQQQQQPGLLFEQQGGGTATPHVQRVAASVPALQEQQPQQPQQQLG